MIMKIHSRNNTDHILSMFFARARFRLQFTRNIFHFVESLSCSFQLFIHSQQITNTGIFSWILAHQKDYVLNLHSTRSANFAGFVCDFGDEFNDEI